MAAKTLFMIVVLLTTIVLAGCMKNEDERLAEITTEHARRQAEQNQEMAHLHKEVAEGTKRLVEANNESRKDWQAMSREVHLQQNQLENDRRALASQRQWDSLLASSVWSLGTIAVCSLPLILCWYLLQGLRSSSTEEAVVNEILISELTAQTPILLPAPLDRQSLEPKQDQVTQGQLSEDSEL